MHGNWNKNTVSQQQPSYSDCARFLSLVSQSSSITRHHELLCWLQGDFQHYLPHDILLSGWGDFDEGVIQHDILSELPGVRSYAIGTDTLPFILGKLRDRWTAARRKPCKVNFREFSYLLGSTALPRSFCSAMSSMQCALIHGIRDERSRQECLYVLLSTSDVPYISAETTFDLLLPYIDTTLRRLTHLPEKSTQPFAPSQNAPEDIFGLSDRETQIMAWVAMGKTNSEIGMILSISGFTVKNHMQRIFQKLNVFNRAQAVSKVIRVAPHG